VTAGSAIAALNPTVTGTVSTYSVNPALPAGVTLNTTTGVITGTPTTPTAPATYVVTATNSGGSTTFNLQMQINGSGVLMDSVVSGLGFTSGTVTGTTDASGRFTYQVGQNVTFRIGGITVGSATPAAIVTPLDFVANATSANVTVQNVVRFLMLLDSDGDPANGITISDALRGRAANWTQVDFATADLATALATVILDTQVDGTQRALASAVDARAHFDGTFRCLFSGYFRGTYAGDDNGRFAFTIAPDGAMAGAAYSVPEDEIIVLAFTQQLQVQNTTVFAAGLAATGSSFQGTFPAYDQVSGTWTDGTFTGTRYGGSATAAYKFLSILRVPNPNFPGSGPEFIAIGSILTEIDTAGVATAQSHTDFKTHQTPTLTATLTGTALTITDGTGNLTLNATVDLAARNITGTFTTTTPAGSGNLLTRGCRLR
jgi:hypothetical protein